MISTLPVSVFACFIEAGFKLCRQHGDATFKKTLVAKNMPYINQSMVDVDISECQFVRVTLEEDCRITFAFPDTELPEEAYPFSLSNREDLDAWISAAKDAGVSFCICAEKDLLATIDEMEVAA